MKGGKVYTMYTLRKSWGGGKNIIIYMLLGEAKASLS